MEYPTKQIVSFTLCRRAAHFATFQSGDASDTNNATANGDNSNEEPNLHTGADTARALGPWSTAVQLANAREKELARRNEKLTSPNSNNKHSGGLKKAELINWKPSRDVSLGPRPQCNVPTLLNIALELVSDYIEDVESLYGLPELVKAKVAATVSRKRVLTPAAFLLFCQNSPVEVNIPNATMIEPDVMKEGMELAWSSKLQKLNISLCGRGFTDDVVSKLAASGATLSGLQSLTITGAYRLGDESLSALLQKAPNLKQLALSQCSRITGVEFLPRLTTSCPALEDIDFSECRGISADALKQTLSSLKGLKHVTLDGLPEVDDGVVAVLAESCSLLTFISLQRCGNITDAALKALAKYRGSNLVGLRIDEAVKVTDDGILHLVGSNADNKKKTNTAVSGGGGGCRQLKVVSLGGCNKLTDTAIQAIAECGTVCILHVNGVTQLSDAGIKAVATHCNATLEEINISWCQGVSEEAIGLLADSCRSRLRKVVAWGCTQLEELFLHGHSNEELVVVGRGEQLHNAMLPL